MASSQAQKQCTLLSKASRARIQALQAQLAARGARGLARSEGPPGGPAHH